MNLKQLESYFHAAQFEQSASQLHQCPADGGGEVAFAGRSNAGKSSAINRLANQRKLARTSKTPGRTQLINFFSLPDQQRLVDLPGYGYAKVSMAKKAAWQRHLEQYLEQRSALRALVLVMDIRHPLQTFDQIMLDWAQQYDMSLHILLTKADKLKRGAAGNTLLAVEKELRESARVSVQLFSATHSVGVDTLRQHLFDWLHCDDEALSSNPAPDAVLDANFSK